MALIDKNDLLHEITQDVRPEGNQRAAQLLEAISNAPEVDPVHAAGGCYCRECELRKDNIYGSYCGRYTQEARSVEPDGFCSYGRRREGGE